MKIRDAILETLKRKPGQTKREIIVAMGSFEVEYFWAPDFGERLDRMVKRKLIHKILVKGKNHYFLAGTLPEGFDISTELGLKIVADYVQENGNEELAHLIRNAKRGR